MRKIVITCLVAMSCIVAKAQHTISGKITDYQNKPLAGTTVQLPDLNRATTSDTSGNYQFANVPQGKIRVQFSFIGFASQVKTVMVDGLPVELNTVMEESVIETEEVVVTSGYNATQHQNAVKIDVLRLSTGAGISPNFSEMITKVPGVDMISKGSGVSKPVIRGLSMNDILVLNNGVRHENYQYSSHHPLGIDEFGIENVEVIKGPASLLYGSDAIGGVINFIKEKPAATGTTVGDYNMQLFSNSRGYVNNLGIKSAGKMFYGGVRIGQKSHADYLQGGGNYIPNSRFNEYSVKANGGATTTRGTFNLYYDYNQEKLGLVEEEAIESIEKRGRDLSIFYEQLNTHTLSSRNKLFMGNMKLDMNAAYENAELTHFGEADVYELQMRLGTLTYEAKLHLPGSERSDYIVGLQGLNQQNTNLNDRDVILLPDATTSNYSAFCLGQRTVAEKLKLQAGLRYDLKNIATQPVGSVDSAAYRQPLNPGYGSFSGSLGGTCNITEKLLFRANIASAYRTPNIAELTANGPHETIYEMGDKNLIPEKSVELDASTHYHVDNVTFDLAGFYNMIANYIFEAPTGLESGTGLPIYQYTQHDATLYGGEAGIHLHPSGTKWLHTEVTYAYVVGKQNDGENLPFIPAQKINLQVKAEKEKLWIARNAFFAISSHTALEQNTPSPDETTTPAYSLLDASVGATVFLGKQQVEITFGASNILDTKYIDHLSTLKEVGLHNPGRSFMFGMRVPFKIKG